MIDDFKYKCIRRSGGRRTSPAAEESVLPSKENFGAGSGGEGWFDGSHDYHFDGSYQVSSPKIDLEATGTQDSFDPPQIVLHASDAGGIGLVGVRGDKGVRITSGPASAEMFVPSTNGFDVEVGSEQLVRIWHGPKGVPNGHITMSAKGTSIGTKEGGVWVTSLTSITLDVAGGTSSITLTPEGITIKGPMVWINS
jgi:hypothetical protein